MSGPDLEAIEAELRAGLEGVTPGPWKPFVKYGVVALLKKGGDKRAREIIAWTGFEASDFPKDAAKNARHLARCSPENIRALLDAIRALRTERDEARRVLARHHRWHCEAGVMSFAHEDGPVEVDLSAEYSDSSLCEETMKVLP